MTIKARTDFGLKIYVILFVTNTPKKSASNSSLMQIIYLLAMNIKLIT